MFSGINVTSSSYFQPPRENCAVMQLGTSWEQQHSHAHSLTHKTKKKNYYKLVTTRMHNIAQHDMIQTPFGVVDSFSCFSFRSPAMNDANFEADKKSKNGHLSEAIRQTSVGFIEKFLVLCHFHLFLICYFVQCMFTLFRLCVFSFSSSGFFSHLECFGVRLLPSLKWEIIVK